MLTLGLSIRIMSAVTSRGFSSAGEHLHGMQGVGGSNPPTSTRKLRTAAERGRGFCYPRGRASC